MEGKGRSIHPPSEHKAESMAHKESKLKGFCTGTRLLIQDMHENSLKVTDFNLKLIHTVMIMMMMVINNNNNNNNNNNIENTVYQTKNVFIHMRNFCLHVAVELGNT
jgi:hypothetical protein